MKITVCDIRTHYRQAAFVDESAGELIGEGLDRMGGKAREFLSDSHVHVSETPIISRLRMRSQPS